jgi:hypothetical protein
MCTVLLPPGVKPIAVNNDDDDNNNNNNNKLHSPYKNTTFQRDNMLFQQNDFCEIFEDWETIHGNSDAP